MSNDHFPLLNLGSDFIFGSIVDYFTPGIVPNNNILRLLTDTETPDGHAEELPKEVLEYW